jgi:hypothetical protein
MIDRRTGIITLQYLEISRLVRVNNPILEQWFSWGAANTKLKRVLLACKE